MYLGELIELHALEPFHLKRANSWMNNPDINRHLSLYLPMPMHATKKWYESSVSDPNQFVFAIHTKDDKKHIGTLGLHAIDWKNSNAEFGIVLGDPAILGKGYGTDAVRTILRMAFNELGLHKVYLKVWIDNARAIRCYEKCGFRREGLLRQIRYHEGRWTDAVIMGILEEEFRKSDKEKCKTKK